MGDVNQTANIDPYELVYGIDSGLLVMWHFCHVTSCQLPKEDREIWLQLCVAYETFSLLVPDNDLNLLELIILLLDESKHSPHFYIHLRPL